MKLSKRGEYALRALIDLGVAQELGRPILQISEFVEKERLPEKFLVQILIQLREAGYVESKRGKHGGYALARPMETISFGQVVRLIDGPLAPIACVSQTAYARCTCPDEAHCGLRMLMLDVRNAIAAVLDRYTLADIVQITLRKLHRDKTKFHFDHDAIHSSDLHAGRAAARSVLDVVTGTEDARAASTAPPIRRPARRKLPPEE